MMWQPMNILHRSPLTQNAASNGERRSAASNLPAQQPDRVQFGGLRKKPAAQQDNDEVDFMRQEVSRLKDSLEDAAISIFQLKKKLAADKLDRMYGDPMQQVQGTEIIDEMLDAEPSLLDQERQELEAEVLRMREAERSADRAIDLFTEKVNNWRASQTAQLKSRKLKRNEKAELQRQIQHTMQRQQEHYDTLVQHLERAQETIMMHLPDAVHRLEVMETPYARYTFNRRQIIELFLPARQKAVAEAIKAMDEAFLFNHPNDDPELFELSQYAVDARKTANAPLALGGNTDIDELGEGFGDGNEEEDFSQPSFDDDPFMRQLNGPPAPKEPETIEDFIKEDNDPAEPGGTPFS